MKERLQKDIAPRGHNIFGVRRSMNTRSPRWRDGHSWIRYGTGYINALPGLSFPRVSQVPVWGVGISGSFENDDVLRHRLDLSSDHEIADAGRRTDTEPSPYSGPASN